MSIVDDLVLRFYRIGLWLKELDPVYQYAMIKYIEQEYDYCDDTELGDFIEFMVQTYMFDINEEDLHDIIRDVIEYSDCNEDLLMQFSNHMLTFVDVPV